MTDGEAKQAVQLTREELHERVWAGPLNKLGAEFGTTGAALAALCKKFSVPYPPPGYWTKLATGKKVERTPLPRLADGSEQTIMIAPASIKPRPTRQTKAQAPQPSPPPKKAAAPAPASRFHPIIDLWIYEREKRRKDARRGLSYDPGEFTDVEKRQHRILNAIFKGVERAGGKIHEGDRRELFAEMNGERIEFNIRQRQRRTSRPLTRDERLQSWNKGRETTFQMNVTELLALKTKTYFPGRGHLEWLETTERSLDDMVPDIVAAFVAAGPELVAQRLEREEEERQRRIEEAKRQEERDRRKRDNNRWHLFGHFAAQAQQADEVRRLLSAMKEKVSDPSETIGDKTMGKWIEWIEDRIERADPRGRDPKDIFSSLAALSAWNYHIQD